jgi:hypothetical protein
VNNRQPILSVLLAAVVLVAGCASPNDTRPIPSPLEGWHSLSLDDFNSNKAIADDYQVYLQELRGKKRQFIFSVDYAQDGTGQRAVHIKQGVSGTYWEHFLFYDRDNKRIKVIKYRNGGYRC